MKIEAYQEETHLCGRDRRLLYEWRTLDRRLKGDPRMRYAIEKRNTQGLPTVYRIQYQIRSICGIEQMERLGEPGICHAPLFADCFEMRLELPPGYPALDAPASFRFLTKDEEGNPIPHPWHPNIRYFGEFAGRVCLNMPDSYTDLAWGVERIALYLRYDLYHAYAEPPYPEDPRVAEWVLKEGEPNRWVFFDQTTNQ
ncbi:MAG: hypothetical protein ACI30I_04385 [Parabacteroides sp.]